MSAQVGLAVDNIKGIRKQAEFKRQVAQVSLKKKEEDRVAIYTSHCLIDQSSPYSDVPQAIEEAVWLLLEAPCQGRTKGV